MMLIKLDYDIKKLNSFILRICLGILLTIIWYRNSNTFPDNVYSLTFAGYWLFLLCNIIFTPRKWKGFLRLILDLSFIGVFLYDKNLNYTLNFLPYLLLIFNSLNHSNKRNRTFLFLFLLHLSIYLTCKFQFIPTFHLVLFLFYIFVIVVRIRRYFRDLNDMIISTITRLFVDDLNENTNHYVLDEVLSKIRRTALKNFIAIENLFLFKKINDQLVPLKGTEFIRENLRFPKEERNEILNFLDTAKNGNFKKGKGVYINGLRVDNILWYNNRMKDEHYLFLIILKNQPNYLAELIINSLRPVFDYIARIFYQSSKFNNQLKFQSNFIKRNITHVLNAQNALHYVNNKLGPLARSIDLLDLYFKKGVEDPKKREYILQQLKNNNNKKQLKEITSKAEVLIRGIDNILEEEDAKIDLKQLLDIVRQNWILFFESTELFKVDIQSLSNKTILINKRLFEYVLIDILENMRKYSQDLVSVTFQISDDKLLIKFQNDIKSFSKEIENLQEIVQLYNHLENDEIYKRKTHGLSFIRRLMRRKNIENHMEIEKTKELFKFRIILPIDENSDI